MKLAVDLDIGTINPPPGSVDVGDDPTAYVAGTVQAAIGILIIVAFLAFFLWTIFAGFRFITSGGDEKTIGQAWSSIYWGIIGMMVVLGSYAIVRLVEIFFDVQVISGGLQLL